MSNSIDPPDLSEEVSFVVSENPALTAVEGDKLRFEQVGPKFGGVPRAVQVRNWQMFEGAVLAVAFSEGNEHCILGSAVVVGPGIALCANHVIDTYLPARDKPDVGLICFGIASHGAEGWRVKYLKKVDRSDVCFLLLEYAAPLPPDRIFRQMGVTTRLPALGEELVIAGFRPQKGRIPSSASGGVRLETNICLCSGKVEQQFPNGRDSLLVPWPALEIDCPAWGGMSGGPVFDSRGWLVGLISRSMETEDEPSPMIAALLWPALGHKLPSCWPPILEVQDKSR